MTTETQANLDRWVAERREEWLRVRSYLRENRHALAKAAAGDYPGCTPIDGVPLLVDPSWLPDGPLPLDRVALELRPELAFGGVTGTEPAAAAVLPPTPDGTPYRRYSAAIAALAAPNVFDDCRTYRLARAGLTGDPARLVFGMGSYFDGVDVGEACAHEYAARVLGVLHGGGLREEVGDPRDPRRRPMNLAITTLSLRYDRHSGEATFPLHWRDPAKVQHAGGLYQVAPVGIFQPSNDSPAGARHDFSLWRCMIREFSEELLGSSEDYGGDDTLIDYGRWPFAVRMEEAHARGTVRAYCLGMGVDPLTFATDLLTAVVFDAEVFDDLFGDRVEINAEGRLLSDLGGQDATAHGFPFWKDLVSRLVHDEPMQAAGAALLALAWRHRKALLS